MCGRHVCEYQYVVGKENIWEQLRTNEGSKTRWQSRAQHKSLDTHRLPKSKYTIQTYIHVHTHTHTYTHIYMHASTHTHTQITRQTIRTTIYIVKNQ